VGERRGIDFINDKELEMNPIEIRHRKIAKLAKGKILDVGYVDHPNYFLRGRVVGIDLIKSEVPKNYHKVIIGDAMDIESIFKPKSFDTIVAAEIIEHLENPAQFLRGTRKILKDNGNLIISTPNPYHLPTLIVNALFLRPVFTAHKTHDPYHINLFPYRNMVTLLEHCDFSVMKVINANGLVLNLDEGPIIPFPKAFSQNFIYVAEKRL
jgi:hypothetical protein